MTAAAGIAERVKQALEFCDPRRSWCPHQCGRFNEETSHVREAVNLPLSHPRRLALNLAVHVRLYQALQAPQRASYLALLAEVAEREREDAHVAELCKRHGCQAPPPEASYFVADCGAFRLR